MFKRFGLGLALVGLCISCEKFAEGRQMFRELLALRDEITKEFHESEVDITISTDNRMKVSFINSPLGSQGRDEKQKRADAVAAFAAAHYKHPLSAVTTVFVQRSRGPGMSASSSEGFAGRLPTKP